MRTLYSNRSEGFVFPVNLASAYDGESIRLTIGMRGIYYRAEKNVNVQHLDSLMKQITLSFILVVRYGTSGL